MRTPLIALLVAGAAAVAAPAAASAAPTVYAAASLRVALPRIAPATYNFAGSNQLQQQIERGAPADVFASAAPDQAQALFREGRCTRPRTFATNTVVVLVPRANPARIRSIYSLRSGARKRVVIGTPGVPIGAYTRGLLDRMRLGAVLTRNIVSQEADVSQITAKVALGSADAGFAYVTDARAGGNRVRSIRIPAWAQPPVRYQLCAVRRPGADTKAAAAYIDRVLGATGRRALKGQGFGLPPRKKG
jgi:molybdate transport system substrate-binding protein